MWDLNLEYQVLLWKQPKFACDQGNNKECHGLPFCCHDGRHCKQSSVSVPYQFPFLLMTTPWFSFGNHAISSSRVLFIRVTAPRSGTWQTWPISVSCPRKSKPGNEIKLRNSLICWERGDFLLLDLELWLCKLVRGRDIESVDLKMKAHLNYIEKHFPMKFFEHLDPSLPDAGVFSLVL